MTRSPLLSALALCAALTACNQPFGVDVPEWPNGGHLGGTTPLSDPQKQAIEGVYAVDQGNGEFGDSVVLKWNGNYLGVYAGVHVGYMVMQAGNTDTSVYVEGYWRFQANDETGLVQFSTPGPVMSPTPQFTGAFGNGQDNPSSQLVLRFVRPIKPALLARPFYIISHHGSGGTPETLPVSENSVEIARVIEQYGANGIEIDVRPTKDGIPILYHDSGLNWRLVQKGPLVGPVENYTFAQIEESVRLLHGEKIPSMAQFLHTVIFETNLKFIYVDMKPTSTTAMAAMAAVQKAALDTAALMGRDVQIYLAITTDDLLASFLALPNYQNIPTICELSLDKLEQAHSQVWSPRFTQNIADADIERLHGEGKLAITWTVNVESFMQQFITAGLIDGLDTDNMTLAAFTYYKQ
jgi:glycerophosphoryl diester phosphodiesterase